LTANISGTYWDIDKRLTSLSSRVLQQLSKKLVNFGPLWKKL